MIYSLTEAGEGHVNEDFTGNRVHPADSRFILCALADGQGGRAGAAAAAKIAVSFTLDAASASEPRALLSPSTWVDICVEADKKVAEDSEAGYCTLVALVATPDWVVGASCGDSAAVLCFRDSEFILTNRQRKNPPVGSGAAQFEPFSSGLQSWWRMCLLSDGVWKYSGWDRVFHHVRGADGVSVVDELRQEVLHNCGGGLADDFTILLIDAC